MINSDPLPSCFILPACSDVLSTPPASIVQSSGDVPSLVENVLLDKTCFNSGTRSVSISAANLTLSVFASPTLITPSTPALKNALPSTCKSPRTCKSPAMSVFVGVIVIPSTLNTPSTSRSPLTSKSPVVIVSNTRGLSCTSTLCT